MSADGPVNLLNAVALAGSQEAVGKGVLIAMNDQINGARDATKTNTTHVETFKSWELGYLGYFQNGKPIFYKASLRRHTAAAEFDISKVTALPRVDIVYLTDPRTAYYRNTTSSNLDQGRLYIDMQIPVTKGCNNYSQLSLISVK